MKRTRNGILIPDVPIMAGGNLPNAVKGVGAGNSDAKWRSTGGYIQGDGQAFILLSEEGLTSIGMEWLLSIIETTIRFRAEKQYYGSRLQKAEFYTVLMMDLQYTSTKK